MHGQRTKTNARTRKGPRRMQVAGARRATKNYAGYRSVLSAAAAAFARTSRWARPTSRRRSTTRSCRSPTARATSSRGSRAGGAGFKGSRKSTPFAAQVTADAAARKGMEQGLQKVEVFVKGRAAAARPPSAPSRPPASRSRASRTSPRRPTTAAAPASGGASRWPATPDPSASSAAARARSCSSRASAASRTSAASSGGPTRRASTAAAARSRASTASSCARSRRPALLRRPGEAVRRLLRKASRQPGITGENLLRMLEAPAWTTCSSASASPASRRQARQLVRHGTGRSTAAASTSPSYQVREGDVITVKAGRTPRRSSATRPS